MYVCVYIYIYLYIHVYLCIYIYIYTSSSRRCPLNSSVNLSNVANLSDEKVPYSISRCQKSPTKAGLIKDT